MAGFTLIDDVVLESAASAINIPVDTAFRKFRVTVFVIKDGTDGAVQLRLNATAGTGYAYQDISADSTTVDGARVTGAAQIVLTTDGLMDGGSAGLFTIEIEKPLATTPARVTAQSSYLQATGPAINYEAIAGEWANTSDLISAINVLAGAANFAIGTRVLIEGAAP